MNLKESPAPLLNSSSRLRSLPPSQLPSMDTLPAEFPLSLRAHTIGFGNVAPETGAKVTTSS